MSMNVPSLEKERREEVMLKWTEGKAGMNVMDVRVREPLDAAMKEYGRDGALTVLRRRKMSEEKLRETCEDVMVKREEEEVVEMEPPTYLRVFSLSRV